MAACNFQNKIDENKSISYHNIVANQIFFILLSIQKCLQLIFIKIKFDTNS